MQTTEVTPRQIRERLSARRIPVGRLATEAGIFPNDLYQILAGNERVGPRRKARIEAAIVRLNLHRDEPVEPTPVEPTVFHVRHSEE